ncbi:hypothetical protein GMOD_00003402 [Pyrenophora seminiperda CCB06]|uniref:Uncharacterized protein n=1 Tax=Pyrenophora seminiperda CCB06 TaxID=1302712 RepID=A0A3M7MIK8_9PLEO|nr:hypothetical protein GMOD_00003402 [Pyrenophora seminiperda CCB06]
MPRRQRSI